MIDSVIGVHLNGALFVSQPIPRRIRSCGSEKVLRWQPRRLMLTSGQHAGLTVQGALQAGRSRMSFRAASSRTTGRWK